MSGLLLSMGRVSMQESRLRVLADQLRFAPKSSVSYFGSDSCRGAFIGHADAGLWAPAESLDQRRQAFLLGRISLGAETWARAETMPYSGGLACRALLDAFAETPAHLPRVLNGGGCALILDGAARALHLFTDRMGVFPLYIASDGTGQLICSHPDVLAACLPASRIDPLSIAEVLAHGHGVHPHTHYREIRQLDAGSHYRFDYDGRCTVTRYWQPNYRADRQPQAASLLIDQMEAAIRQAVRQRTQARLGKTGVFLSAGIDSRALLFPRCPDAELVGITLFDEENAELAGARALAASAGIEHLALRRDPEHYFVAARESVRIAGGAWDICDSHFLAARQAILATGCTNLLSGCFADWLYKGLMFNKAAYTLLKRPLPIYQLSAPQPQWYAAHCVLAEPWGKSVRTRADEVWQLGLADPASPGAIWELGIRRIWPINREADILGRLILQRAFPWDAVNLDTGLLDLLQDISPAQMVSGDIWRQAVARIAAPARHVADNNIGAPVGASAAMRTAHFLKWTLHRKITGRDIGGTPLKGPSNRGSWPNYPYLISHSRLLPELWNTPAPEYRELVTELLGFDAWRHSLEYWAAEHPTLFYRLLSQKLWWESRIR